MLTKEHKDIWYLVVWQLSGSLQAVIMQFSGGHQAFCQEVVRQSSGSYMAARIMQPSRLEKLFSLGLVKNIPRKLPLLL